MKFLTNLGSSFWDPSFWLPPNSSWDGLQTVQSGKGYRMAKVEDLFFAWKLVPLVLLVKYMIERCVGGTLASWAGINDKPRQRPPEIEHLEKAHRSNPNRKWSQPQLTAFSKQLDWPEEQLEEWFKARRKFGRPTTTEKFCDSCWRFLIFVSIFIYGLHAHWSKEWFWDFKLCWENFPQPVPDDLYWYYIISLANYSSWTISQFWDVQRKDPGIMMCHHIVTVTLMTTQWILGCHRAGLLVSLLHDVGDFWVELSKCLKYLGLKTVCQITFVFFTAVWVATRNIIIPLYLLPSFYLHSPYNASQLYPFSCFHGPCDISSFKFTISHAFIIVGYSMSTLHVYWTYLICKILYRGLFLGKLEDDVESGSEDDSDGD